MKPRKIWITTYDLDRLTSIIDNIRTSNAKKKADLETLQGELERATLAEPQDIPKDVVTMNSRVRLRDLETDEEMVCTLVFPSDALIEKNKISIISPIGTALIGYRVGHTINWKVSSGEKKLKIEEILYQPEAAGNYDQ